MTDKQFAEKDALHSIHDTIKNDFTINKRILTFEEFVSLLSENPERHTRSSTQYLLDMLEFFGKKKIIPKNDMPDDAETYHFNIFDEPVDGLASKVIGLNAVQTLIYRELKSFNRQGINNRLLLLHGPNGSAKTTVVHALMGGMEKYSYKPEGAVYTFNWLFPVEKYTKKGIGLHSGSDSKTNTQSYAKIPDEEAAARIPCDMKDHPLLLIPLQQRKNMLEKLLGKERTDRLWESLSIYLKEGDLCHRCKEIFESLLTANNGDYEAVLRHIQIERFYYSSRYRKGLVTIEPKLHVDANYHQLTYDRRISALPASLQSLNLFTLNGDLIDGNRGMVEFSDLLKRPVDSFKYLLTACETGSISVGSANANLDILFVGSCNDLQLDAFKEMPDFASFKARIKLLRVPYLLSIDEEKEIYTQILPKLSGEKHISPHVPWTLALWTVLTRLKRPESSNYPSEVQTLISGLTPLEKAVLYSTGEMPMRLTPDERKVLKSNLHKIWDEHQLMPFYEGRMGASVREAKTILYDAIQNREFPCLSPLSVIQEMENFVKRISDYEFLRLEVNNGYHDAPNFINVVREAYTEIIDREIRSSMGIYEASQWEDFLKKYVTHISHLLKKEKIPNSITGKMEDPDKALISEFEKIIGVPVDSTELETFRKQIISRVGVWSLDNKGEDVAYAKIFPEYWSKLEKHYYESQKAMLTKMNNALMVYDTEQDDPYSEGHKLARQTLKNMETNLGYCRNCAKEVINLLLRKSY